MTLFEQQLVNGISLGALYALFAMGFGLVFSSLGILNFAHGMFATWACILAYFFVNALALPLLLALLLALAAAALLGVLLDRVAFETMRRRAGGLLGPLMTSVGAWIVLLALAELAIGPVPLVLSGGTLGSVRYEVGGIRIRAVEVVAFAACLVVALALHWGLRLSKLGLAIRAVGWDQRAATIAGINSTFVIRFTVGLSAVIAGLAGLFDGLLTGSVSPPLGDALLIKGFAAVVVGGVGDVRGSVIGGLFIGLSEVLTAQYLGSSYRDAVTFGLLLVFLVARPRGLFGKIDPVRA